MPSPDAYPSTITINSTWSAETVAVQAGRPERLIGAPMNTTISMNSTYVHTSEISYARDGNEGWHALEVALGELDGGTTVTFASGLAAASAITSLIPHGGIVVVPNAAYYGVKNIFDGLANRNQITIRLVDGGDTAAVIAASDGAAMVWMESIANPTLVVADIPAICTAAKEQGAITVVDATFATPLRQQPIYLGADVVLHSGTKFIGGHSDLLLGAVTCAKEEHAEAILTHRHDHGSTPGSLEAFLALRGLRTLALRVDKSEANAHELAKRLSGHSKISQVNYPSLPSDSQHEKAARLLPHGCGGMLSFEIDATIEQVDEILRSLKLIAHATSLGGVESLIERRARYIPEQQAGVPATLCRYSVGIENVDDLWTDLSGAINRVLG